MNSHFVNHLFIARVLPLRLAGPLRPNRLPSTRLRMGLSIAVVSLLSGNLLLARDLNTYQPQVAPTTVVLGADNPLVDVPAVQSAVDQGGTVILRGTFDFGADASGTIVDLGDNNSIFLPGH